MFILSLSAVAANVRGTTPLFFPLLNDQFSRGKNNGATSIIIYQQRERRSALCYAQAKFYVKSVLPHENESLEDDLRFARLSSLERFLLKEEIARAEGEENVHDDDRPAEHVQNIREHDQGCDDHSDEVIDQKVKEDSASGVGCFDILGEPRE